MLNAGKERESAEDSNARHCLKKDFYAQGQETLNVLGGGFSEQFDGLEFDFLRDEKRVNFNSILVVILRLSSSPSISCYNG